MKKKSLVFLIMITAILVLSIIIINIKFLGNSIKEETVTGKATNTNLAISISVIGPPELSVINPENKTYITSKNILLNYSEENADSIWYNIDNSENTTITSAVYFNTTKGTHILYLYANNSEGENSTNVSFTVNSDKFKIYYNEYATSNKGSSTDFNKSSYENLQNLSDIILHNIQHGKIKFNEAINITDDANSSDKEVDLDTYTNISSNRIEIDSTALPNFNKSATLWLYNLTYSNPRILRDGSVCSSAICTEESYSGGTLKFNVTQFSVYSAEETPSGEEIISGGGSGGGGGILDEENFSVDSEEIFSVNPEEIKVEIKQGQIITKSIDVTNTRSQTLDIKIEKSDSLKDFIILKEDSFSLKGGESKMIDIDFLARKETIPDLYLGKIILKAEDIEKEIFISLEIESPEPLLDVKVKIPEEYLKVTPGKKILGEIEIYNMGEMGRIDVEVNYIIKDENNIITEDKDTIAIETQTNFLKEISIPENTKDGRYIFCVKVTYNGKTALSSSSFEVKKEEISSKEKIYIVLIILLIITISIMIYYLKRKKSLDNIKRRVDLSPFINYGGNN